jgi:hypothetical protein
MAIPLCPRRTLLDLLLVETTSVVWASLASVVHQLIVISGRTMRLIVVVIMVMRTRANPNGETPTAASKLFCFSICLLLSTMVRCYLTIVI